MANFDAALNRQLALAAGRQIAFDHIADVGHQLRLGQVTPPVHAAQVRICFVSTADKIGHQRDFAVSNHRQGLIHAHRPQIPRLAIEMRFNFCAARQAEIGQACQFADFDFIDFMVAAQQQQVQLGFDDIALVITHIRGNDHRLDHALQRYAQQLGHIGAHGFARGGYFLQGLRRRSAAMRGC